MNQNSSVSIIIVNYCGKKLLEKCLDSIYKTNYDEFEIILVDNNSNDGSVEFVKSAYPDVKIIILTQNYGFSIPNNIAAKTANGKYLAFLNNDTTVTPNWLSELVNALEEDKTIAFGQSLILHEDGDVDSSGDYIDEIGRAYSSKVIPKEKKFILSPKGAAMITRKDVFLDLGGFDESYFASFEDVEIGWKSWLFGFKTIVVPKSVVYHYGGITVKKIPDIIAFHGVKNNLMLRTTFFSFFDYLKSLLYIISLILFQKITKTSFDNQEDLKFKIPNFQIILKACMWNLKNYRMIFKKRKTLKSRQVITNNELKKLGLITKVNRKEKNLDCNVDKKK